MLAGVRFALGRVCFFEVLCCLLYVLCFVSGLGVAWDCVVLLNLLDFVLI